MKSVININSLFEDCLSLSFIDLSYINSSKIEYYNNIFKGINKEGTIKFNSSIFDTKILKELPDNWTKIDIK